MVGNGDQAMVFNPELPLAVTIILSTGERKVVEILSPPSTTGLCKCRHGEKTLVRHRNQLAPITDKARELLGK